MRRARENTSWGYLRIVGERRKLGIEVSATLVRIDLPQAYRPVERRESCSWSVLAPFAGKSKFTHPTRLSAPEIPGRDAPCKDFL